MLYDKPGSLGNNRPTKQAASAGHHVHLDTTLYTSEEDSSFLCQFLHPYQPFLGVSINIRLHLNPTNNSHV